MQFDDAGTAHRRQLLMRCPRSEIAVLIYQRIYRQIRKTSNDLGVVVRMDIRMN